VIENLLQPPTDPAPEGKEYAISGYTKTAAIREESAVAA
jgi:hypothetical protein